MPPIRSEQWRDGAEEHGLCAVFRPGEPATGRGDRFGGNAEPLVELGRNSVRADSKVDLEEALQAPGLEIAGPREQLFAVSHERLRMEHGGVLEDAHAG